MESGGKENWVDYLKNIIIMKVSHFKIIPVADKECLQASLFYLEKAPFDRIAYL